MDKYICTYKIEKKKTHLPLSVHVTDLFWNYIHTTQKTAEYVKVCYLWHTAKYPRFTGTFVYVILHWWINNFQPVSTFACMSAFDIGVMNTVYETLLEESVVYDIFMDFCLTLWLPWHIPVSTVIWSRVSSLLWDA